MADVVSKEPYKAKRLREEIEIPNDPNYIPKRAQAIEDNAVPKIGDVVRPNPNLNDDQFPSVESKPFNYTTRNKSRLAGKRLQKSHPLGFAKKLHKPKKAKRMANKIQKESFLKKIATKILNTKIIKSIFKIASFIALALIMLINKGSSANNKARTTNIKTSNSSISEVNSDYLENAVNSANLYFQEKEPEINFEELSASEKVDYLMQEYGFSIEELRDILFALDSKIDEELRAQIDAKYSQVLNLPEANYLGDDFVGYSSDVADLLPKLNVNYMDYKNIIAPTLIKVGGSLNYKEAFALMTLVLNRTLSTEHPNNILDVITEPGGFDAYLSGEYKTVNIEDYPDALQAFKDCLWNFIQDQTIRLHNYTDVMPWDTNQEDFQFFFNILGNHYGNPLTEEKTEYLDIEPFLTYG